MSRLIYGYFCWVIFLCSALFALPLLAISAKFGRTYQTAGKIYQMWARLVVFLCAIPIKVEDQEPHEKERGPVIYCPNHSSYFDIPILYAILPHTIAFLGKSELGSLPIFGYSFRKVHISVNRKSPKGKARSLEKAREMLKKGRSVVIFPEGTIDAAVQPGMLPFKGGAFKLAIEEQVPIVPICIPYNWIFMPDDGKFLPRRQALSVYLLKPIVANEKPDQLKAMVRSVLEEEIMKHNRK
jgi:1-acyl-sn-glycerol-3-phosphate acyltransferase